LKLNTAYRLIVGGEGERREYHLYSRWLVQIYVQTYIALGKQINAEQLVDGFWQPAAV